MLHIFNEVQFINGQKSVVLTAKWGTHRDVPGVKVWVGRQKKGATRALDLADTADGDDEAQIREAARAASAAVKVKTRILDEGEVRAIGFKKDGKATTDPEDDQSLIDEIFGKTRLVKAVE